MIRASESIQLKAVFRLVKWKDPVGEIARGLQAGLVTIDEVKAQFPEACFEDTSFEKNVALNEGLTELLNITCGTGTPTKWDSANARLGVGNGNAAADPSQTGLQGASKTFKAMDGGFPSVSNQTATWQSTFGSAEANYAWEEYTVVNAADDTGKNLNRKVESKGTKSAGESWTLQVKITAS